MNANLILLTDSYKVSHHKQYPPDTRKVYSYFESRGGVYKDVVFFGLQYFLKAYLENNIITQADVDEAEELFKLHFGTDKLFNKKGWEYIIHEHDGRLPIEIKAVPEGTPVPYLNVMMTVENTDPKCYWLTNYIETLLVQTWYPCTVATQSREIKKMILKYLEETGDPALIDFKLHDFGFRGVSSVESAGIGGAAHLINFKGSDTMAALTLISGGYGEEMAGFSIPAAEHSTITSWGRENEADAMENMLDQFPEGLVAVVSDSFDIYKACSDIWGGKLKEKVLKRNGTLIIRPDSGHPPEVIRNVLNILGDKFGYETNSKGFKVLNPKVRVIQGDGVEFAMINRILEDMKIEGWSADNIAFGMGGALLQKLNRDTQKFAFKCSYVEVGDESRDVYKQPITDDGKRSKAGQLKLIRKEDGSFDTLNRGVGYEKDLLETVFLNGEIVKEYTFEEVRNNAKI
jgi:nicotinamide phosphoribosyltransferase